MQEKVFYTAQYFSNFSGKHAPRPPKKAHAFSAHKILLLRDPSPPPFPPSPGSPNQHCSKYMVLVARH